MFFQTVFIMLQEVSMDFRELQYVTTVADCGSVTAAAKKLFISQPSLSYIISKIELDVGVKLFDRRKSPLTLTYAGEKYVDTARKILLLNDNLRRELVDIGLGEKGKISFGIPTERAGYMLPKVIPRYKEMFPKVDLQIYEAMTDELLDALLKDEINFYITPRSRKELPSGLTSELIYHEKLYLVASPKLVQETDWKDPEHPFALPAFLRSHPFIMIKRGHAIRRKTDTILKHLKVTPEISMEVSSCISAVQLADSGLGITLVPQRALEALGGTGHFCCIPYSDTPDSWAVHVIYKEDAYLDRAEQCFIQLLKEVFFEYE